MNPRQKQAHSPAEKKTGARATRPLVPEFHVKLARRASESGGGPHAVQDGGVSRITYHLRIRHSSFACRAMAQRRRVIRHLHPALPAARIRIN